MEPIDRNLVSIVKTATEEKKGENLVLLNVEGRSDLCNYMAVCSAENPRQARAIADRILELAKKDLHLTPSGTEGMDTGYWILLDFSNIMVHIFNTEYRQYYAIESLWPNAEISV